MKARSGSGRPPSGFEICTEIASLAACGVGNAMSAAGSGNGMRGTGREAAAAASDGKGLSPPVLFHRLLAAATFCSDHYIDYYNLNFPVRPILEAVPLRESTQTA